MSLVAKCNMAKAILLSQACHSNASSLVNGIKCPKSTPFQIAKCRTDKCM